MSKRVTIIDNDWDTLEAMTAALCYEGFDVLTEPGTEDIFGLIETVRPDIMLIDYLLSGINGGELCSQIKNDNLRRHIPVIIVSAYSRVINSLGFYGCSAFIAKPFNLDDLVGEINELTLN